MGAKMALMVEVANDMEFFIKAFLTNIKKRGQLCLALSQPQPLPTRRATLPPWWSSTQHSALQLCVGKVPP